MADIAIILAYVGVATLLLASGDRLGERAACFALRRCQHPPLLCLPAWLHVSIALLIPSLVLAGVFVTAVAYSRNALEIIANNLELILLAVFFLTGLTGGFLCGARRL